jgi:hypothetical protein
MPKEDTEYEALGEGSPLYANLLAGGFAGIMVSYTHILRC